VLPKGKPWSVEEERRLKELLGSGYSTSQVATELGKSCEGVRQKMLKLGLKEQQLRNSSCCSSNVPLPENLPSVENAMKEVWSAIQSLKQPNLSHAESQRLRAIIMGARIYKELFADQANYRRIEEELVEMRKRLGEMIGRDNDEKKETDVPLGESS
jgi:hypothetical protein